MPRNSTFNTSEIFQIQNMTGDEVWIAGEHLGVLVAYNSEWKSVDDEGTDRMKVPGGWLYRTIVTSGGLPHPGTAVAMVFVPEPKQGFRRVSVSVGSASVRLGRTGKRPKKPART